MHSLGAAAHVDERPCSRRHSDGSNYVDTLRADMPTADTYLQGLLVIHEDQHPLQVSSMYASAHSIHSVLSGCLQIQMLQLWR